jgi:hypothetical protein
MMSADAQTRVRKFDCGPATRIGAELPNGDEYSLGAAPTPVNRQRQRVCALASTIGAYRRVIADFALVSRPNALTRRDSK